MFAKFVVLFTLAVAVSASDYSSFSYNVADPYTGDFKSQIENRAGDNVNGQYSLLESDGTRRTVDYAAGAGGFNAVVRKDPALFAAAPIATPLTAGIAAAPIATGVTAARIAAPIAAAPIATGITAARIATAPIATGFATTRIAGAPIAAGIAAAPIATGIASAPIATGFAATRIAAAPIAAGIAAAPIATGFTAPLSYSAYSAPYGFNYGRLGGFGYASPYGYSRFY